MGMPKGQEPDFGLEYRLMWKEMRSEESKLKLLLMLKERRDKNGDDAAGVVLAELGYKWVMEKWEG